MTTSAPPNVIIVGAGLAGAFMAVMLGRRGFSVAVYERRSDMCSGVSSVGPSMNLGLSRRGIHALTEIGLIDQVMAMTIPRHGRMIHALDNTLTFQPYGKNASQSIFAIKRNSLNITLINAAEAMPNVQFFFGMRCSRLDKEHGTIYFHDEQTDTDICVESELIVVFPFYAQGMNAAFEDCLALNECLDRHPDCWEGAFAEYQAICKANTDALAEMSQENFIELRDKVRSPTLRTHTQINRLLGTLFPRTCIPLHAMVTHTTIPYAQALAHSKKQNAILKRVSVGLVALLFLLFRDLLLYSLSRMRSNQH